MKLKKKIIFLTLIILAAAGFFIYKSGKKETPIYITDTIKRGKITKEIDASGTINPVNVVKVGTQVSGIIEKIYVNYNDKVEKDQILAELDKSILQNQKNIAKASLDKAAASKNLARLDYERNSSLFKSNYISKSELDKYEADYKRAKADFDSANSEYQKSETNLGYATVRSPVFGVVISKEVEEGQTVAASLQTPDLFQIAEDLTKMQIEAAISEADISAIKQGQSVNFTVDAYENQNFIGIVDQIRLNPTTDQNVVTYTVVINIDNSDLKLLPGMTAFINILIDQKENILKISNNVFNFKPAQTNNQNRDLTKDETTIYLLENSGNIRPIKISKGFIGQFETEIISSEIKEGDKIIEEILGQGKAGTQNPNMRRRPF